MIALVDERSLSIVALSISSMAIFAGLWQAGGPKLAGSFFGSNPFAIKASAINYYIERIFVFIGVVGVSLQAAVFVFADQIPSPSHPPLVYAAVLAASLLFSLAILAGARHVALKRAKRVWWPQLFPDQARIYMDVAFAAEHEGFTRPYWPEREHISPSRKAQNDERLTTNLEQLEELFLERVQTGSLIERVHRLAKVFPADSLPPAEEA